MGDQADTVRSVYVQNYVEGGGLYPTALSLDWMKDHDVMLVYEIDGQPLRVQDGYPVQLWTGGTHAGNYKKQAYRGQILHPPDCGNRRDGGRESARADSGGG